MAEDTLLEFPTDFPIKITGGASDEFRSLAIGIVSRHFAALDPSPIEERPSKGGKDLATIKDSRQIEVRIDYLKLIHLEISDGHRSPGKEMVR